MNPTDPFFATEYELNGKHLRPMTAASLGVLGLTGNALATPGKEVTAFDMLAFLFAHSAPWGEVKRAAAKVAAGNKEAWAETVLGNDEWSLADLAAAGEVIGKMSADATGSKVSVIPEEGGGSSSGKA